MKRFVLLVSIVLLALATSAGAQTFLAAPVGVDTATPQRAFHIVYPQSGFQIGSGQILIQAENSIPRSFAIGFATDADGEGADGYGALQAGWYGVKYLPIFLNPVDGNVAVGKRGFEKPSSKLTVYNGDIQIARSPYGVYGPILAAPDGHCARVTLADDNSLVVTNVDCDHP